jgi:hypothetical protein
MSAGIANDELLEAALRVLDEAEEEVTLNSLARQVGKKLGIEADKGALEQLLRREATSYVLPPQEEGAGWSLTEAGRVLVQRRSVESEERELTVQPAAAPAPDQEIQAPFNPALIKVDTEQMPIYHALRLIQQGRIVLDPEFQRNFIWDNARQSRLIESILLRIPLPAFYLDATRENTYLVVDGLQRLSTLDRFCNKQAFRLSGLSYLKDLENRRFDELPASMQTTITERTKLTVYTILPETPPQVKFLIFHRVNTGGLALTSQEIRHALYQGPATRLLKELAEDQAFLDATDRSVSPLRMDDRECVLRFIAFHLYPYEEFGSRLTPGEPANLDGLLNRTMDELNRRSEPGLAQIRDDFTVSMRKAHMLFGPYAFRKRYQREEHRQPINKPLFEVWSVLLKAHPQEELEKRREELVDGFIEVMQTDIDFVNAISYATGSPGRVKYRFGRIQRLLQEIMG